MRKTKHTENQASIWSGYFPNDTLDAWLTFFGSDKPEDIERLLEVYPEFIPMYQSVYNICRNVENVMGIFSEELKILDQNTVMYMIDEMQDTIDEQKAELVKKDEELNQKTNELNQSREEISKQQDLLRRKEQEIEELKRRLAE